MVRVTVLYNSSRIDIDDETITTVGSLKQCIPVKEPRLNHHDIKRLCIIVGVMEELHDDVLLKDGQIVRLIIQDAYQMPRIRKQDRLRWERKKQTKALKTKRKLMNSKLWIEIISNNENMGLKYWVKKWECFLMISYKKEMK